jgi:hypothetical protein
MRTCIGCGCTDYAACETETGPCHWAVRLAGAKGVCSRCAQIERRLKRYRARQGAQRVRRSR